MLIVLDYNDGISQFTCKSMGFNELYDWGSGSKSEIPKLNCNNGPIWDKSSFFSLLFIL